MTGAQGLQRNSAECEGNERGVRFMRDARLWLRRPPRRLLSTAAKPKYLRSR